MLVLNFVLLVQTHMISAVYCYNVFVVKPFKVHKLDIVRRLILISTNTQGFKEKKNDI